MDSKEGPWGRPPKITRKTVFIALGALAAAAALGFASKNPPSEERAERPLSIKQKMAQYNDFLEKTRPKELE